MPKFPAYPKIIVNNSSGLGTFLNATAAASATFPSANRAYYLPFIVNSPVTITDISVYIGATNGSPGPSNIDVGIYDFSGTKLVSSGAQDTTAWTINTLRTVGITDTVLGRGRFYAAIAADNTTLALFRNSFGGSSAPISGQLMQATAYPLPATATFAASTAYSPVMTLHTGGATI